MESCERTSSQTAATQLPHQLCDACLADFPPHQEWPLEEHFRKHPHSLSRYILRRCTLKDICITATAGCHPCVKMLNAFRSRVTMETQIRLVLAYAMHGDFFDLHATYDDSGKEQSLSTNLCLQRLDRTGIGRHELLEVQNIPLPDSNLSPLALNKAKEWLHLCRHTHQQCRPGGSMTLGSQQSKFIRLIDIQSQDGHSCTCRLVNHFLGGDVDYMTLSYRWTAEVKKTAMTQKNKGVYYNSIPTNTWPQIYHDAVLVALHLNIQYLWIDALCIIQDDPKDWNEQAALMNIIYERGVLNIAGVMGEEADGLRIYRDPLRVFGCALSHRSGETWVFHAYNYEGLNLTHDAPLYRRAWTFQERVLSTRTLHFGNQLVWECFEGEARETHKFHEHFPEDTPLSLKQALRNSASIANSPEMGSTTIQSFSALWKRAVQYFSRMDLTEPTDRMPALQGITNRLGYLLNLDPARCFVAGLWLVDCTQLAWCRANDRNWLTPKDDDLARELSIHYPSWSWAISTQGVSFTRGFTIIVMTQLVELGTVPSHCRSVAHPCFITVDKCISVVSLDNTSSSSNMQTFTGITMRGKFIHWFEVRRILKLGQSQRRFVAMGCVPATGLVQGSSFLFFVILDRPISNCYKRKGLKLLPICGRRGKRVEGLVIAFCGFDDGLAVYRRLGHFRVSGEGLDYQHKVAFKSLEEYLHLPTNGTESEPTPELRRELDEWPPFKLI